MRKLNLLLCMAFSTLWLQAQVVNTIENRATGVEVREVINALVAEHNRQYNAAGFSFNNGGTSLSSFFEIIPLANGGLGVALADPEADNVLFWNNVNNRIEFKLITDLTATDGIDDVLSEGQTLTADRTIERGDFEQDFSDSEFSLSYQADGTDVVYSTGVTTENSGQLGWEIFNTETGNRKELAFNNTQGLILEGDGFTVGAPTGGNRGAGSINTQSLFINNEAVRSGIDGIDDVLSQGQTLTADRTIEREDFEQDFSDSEFSLSYQADGTDIVYSTGVTTENSGQLEWEIFNTETGSRKELAFNNTQGLILEGDGFTVGAPTGGNKGSGSINTQSIFINNQPVRAGIDGIDDVLSEGQTLTADRTIERGDFEQDFSDSEFSLSYQADGTDVVYSTGVTTENSGQLGWEIFNTETGNRKELAFNNTQGLILEGDGFTVGAPTGGNKGSGSINAQSLYINNEAVRSGIHGIDDVLTEGQTLTADRTITLNDDISLTITGGNEDSNVTINPEGNVIFEPDLDVNIQPIEDVNINPSDGDVYLSPAQGNVEIRPNADVTVEPVDGDVVISPAQGNVTIEPQGNVRIAPQGSVEMASVGDIIMSTGENGNITFSNSPLKNVGTPVAATDAATKQYVDNREIPDGSITEDKIANNAVTGPKIGRVSITNEKIVNNAVTNSKLADGAVATAELFNNAVTTVKIADGAVTPAKIAGYGIDNVLAQAQVLTADRTISNNTRFQQGFTSTEFNFSYENEAGDATYTTGVSTENEGQLSWEIFNPNTGARKELAFNNTQGVILEGAGLTVGAPTGGTADPGEINAESIKVNGVDVLTSVPSGSGSVPGIDEVLDQDQALTTSRTITLSDDNNLRIEGGNENSNVNISPDGNVNISPDGNVNISSLRGGLNFNTGFNGNINFNGNRLQDVGNPTDDTDAVNKQYVDAIGIDDILSRNQPLTQNRTIAIGTNDLFFNRSHSSLNTERVITQFNRMVDGNGQAENNIGSAISLGVENSDGNISPLSISHVLATAANNLENSLFKIEGLNRGIPTVFVSVNSLSTSMGRGSASASESTAIGSLSRANGTQSVAVGRTAVANNEGAVSIGFNATTSSNDAIAIGHESRAEALSAIAINSVNAEANSFKAGNYLQAGLTRGLTILNSSADANLTTAANGSMYYNTADHEFRGYVNGAWTRLGAGAGGGAGVAGIDDVLARNQALTADRTIERGDFEQDFSDSEFSLSYQADGTDVVYSNGVTTENSGQLEWEIFNTETGSRKELAFNNTQGLILEGDGFTVGAPTGGNKGAGSINAQSLYINNQIVRGGIPGIDDVLAQNQALTTSRNITLNDDTSLNIGGGNQNSDVQFFNAGDIIFENAGDINFNDAPLINVPNPVNAKDAANKQYVDGLISSGSVTTNSIGSINNMPVGSVLMGQMIWTRINNIVSFSWKNLSDIVLNNTPNEVSFPLPLPVPSNFTLSRDLSGVCALGRINSSAEASCYLEAETTLNSIQVRMPYSQSGTIIIGISGHYIVK